MIPLTAHQMSRETMMRGQRDSKMKKEAGCVCVNSYLCNGPYNLVQSGFLLGGLL